MFDDEIRDDELEWVDPYLYQITFGMEVRPWLRRLSKFNTEALFFEAVESNLRCMKGVAVVGRGLALQAFAAITGDASARLGAGLEHVSPGGEVALAAHAGKIVPCACATA